MAFWGILGGKMQKELNPELFGESLTGRTRVMDATASHSHQPMELLEKKYLELKDQMGQMVDHLSRIAFQTNESLKQQQSKFEKIHLYLQKLEQNDHSISMEASQRIQSLQAKLGDRKLMDQKIQEMIDRHNSILKSYEVRLNQLQKLIADKDAQLLSAQASLNEAKMEIARLKRL